MMDIHYYLYVKQDEFYLCDCCDTYKEQRWLLAPIKIEEIAKLLTNNITIREVFEKAEGTCCVATWSTGDLHEKYMLINSNDFKKDDLPDTGEYVDSEEDEHQDYLNRIQNRICYKKEQSLKRRVIIKGDDINDSMEYGDLIYQYQKGMEQSKAVISTQICGSIDENVTNQDFKRNYKSDFYNEHNVQSSYHMIAA